MRKSYISCFSFFVIGSIFLSGNVLMLTTSAYVTQEGDISTPKQIGLKQNLVEINSEHFDSSVNGYKESQANQRFFTFSNGLLALNLLQEMEESTQTQQYYLERVELTVEFIKKYLLEPYHRDSRGLVNYYDRQLGEESYPRASKKAVDQLLAIAVLSNILPHLDESDPRITDYTLIRDEAIAFLREYFLDQEYFGFYRAVTPLGLVDYAVDQTKSIEDLSWMTLIYQMLPDAVQIEIDPSGDHLTQMLQFINTNLLEVDGAVPSFASVDGSSKLKEYSSKANALYAIANLEVYEQTTNAEYLEVAMEIFNFMRTHMWDLGFQGFFEVVDDNRDLTVRTKSATGNLLASQLSYQLSALQPTNKTYRDTFSRLQSFLTQNFYVDNNLNDLIYASVNRIGQVVGSISLKNNIIDLYKRIQQPHFYSFSCRDEIPLGVPFTGSLSLKNPYQLNLSIRIGSSALQDRLINTTKNEINFNVPLSPNVQTGGKTVEVEILYNQAVVDKLYFTIKIGSGMIGLPILLLIGISIIGVLILIIKRPDLLSSLFIEETELNQKDSKSKSSTQNVNDNDTAS